MFKQEVTKEEINELPLIRYEGKVEVVTTEEELAEALVDLRRQPVLGFDTESRPSFRKGEYYPISLVQIATPGLVYLIRTNKTGFSSGLRALFETPTVIKAGISILDDLRELQKLASFKPGGIIELNQVAQAAGIKNIGVRSLSAIIMGIRISKSQQTSNWERDTLSKSQIYYAATDAWVCLQLYEKLERWGYIQPGEHLFQMPAPAKPKFRPNGRSFGERDSF
ncbi:3'-5' exonuclease [Flammeovirgaceae bacterium 311]|nr:3'-5' exonuclease [Flammeovirgaceae bacterium 311]